MSASSLTRSFSRIAEDITKPLADLLTSPEMVEAAGEERVSTSCGRRIYGLFGMLLALRLRLFGEVRALLPSSGANRDGDFLRNSTPSGPTPEGDTAGEAVFVAGDLAPRNGLARLLRLVGEEINGCCRASSETCPFWRR